jgi:hypothetical protein
MNMNISMDTNMCTDVDSCEKDLDADTGMYVDVDRRHGHENFCSNNFLAFSSTYIYKSLHGSFT